MNNKHLAFLGLVILVLWFCAIAFQVDRRSDVPLDDLLLNDPALDFPASWFSGLGWTSVEWRPSGLVLPQLDSRQAQSSAGRAWTDYGAGTSTPGVIITQRVFRYRSPLEANIWSWVYQPENTVHLPNFELRDDAPKRYPSGWTYRSNSASQEHVVCGMETPDDCQAWYYLARYGQIVMEVQFFAPNRGIGSDLFEQIVTPVDTHMAKRLANN